MTGDRLRAWLAEHGETQQVFADRIGTTRVIVGYCVNGTRRPSQLVREAIERGTNGDIKAEDWLKVEPEEPPPSSRERPAPEVQLGSTPDEIRASVRRCKALAQKPGLSPTQQAQLEGKCLSGLSALARLEERQAIVDHPDFAPLVEDLVAAVRSALGPDAPDGIEARIADELERLQATRAALPGRAAA